MPLILRNNKLKNRKLFYSEIVKIKMFIKITSNFKRFLKIFETRSTKYLNFVILLSNIFCAIRITAVHVIRKLACFNYVCKKILRGAVCL